MKKLFLISILFLANSCYIFKDFEEEKPVQKVRFVDLNGNPNMVELKTPKQNIDALNQQGKLTSNRLEEAPQQEVEQKFMAQNKYAKNEALNQPVLAPKQQVENDQVIEETEEVAVLDDENSQKEISYDLAKEEPKEKEEVKEIAKIQETKINAGYYVQTGSFIDSSHADVNKNKVKKIVKKLAKIDIYDANVNGKKYHRVLVGPYKTKKEANLMIAKLKKNKQESIIVKIK